MSEFTKGVWGIDTNGNIWAEDTKICEMSSMPSQSSIYRSKLFCEHEANRHLIAAAPDLYRELELIVKHWDGEPEDMIGPMTALAKARGEL